MRSDQWLVSYVEIDPSGDRQHRQVQLSGEVAARQMVDFCLAISSVIACEARRLDRPAAAVQSAG